MMTDYLQMKIDNNKSYTRMLKRSFRNAMFASVVTVVLGIVCYLLDNMYCVGVMVMASIYVLFFMVEHWIEMKHQSQILLMYETFDWKKDIEDAKELYQKQTLQYEMLIKREKAGDQTCF